MKVNLNSVVTVKLTEHGRSVLDRHISSVAGAILTRKFAERHGLTKKELQRAFEESVNTATVGMDVASDGTFLSQLWELMQIFGSSMGRGCDPVFEDMNVEVEQADA